jgi:DNA repair exonuclease SbcCD ATPase subunit
MTGATRIAQLSEKFTNASARLHMISSDLDTVSRQKEKLTSRSAAIEEVMAYTQEVAKQTQEQIKFQLEDIVNLALNAVYSDKYKFSVLIEAKRGGTEARLVLFNENGDELDPMSSTGGGVCDILSFALRIALLIISKNERVLIMDEPFKFISKDVKEPAIEIIKRISTDLNVQIICITHDEELIQCSDKVFRVAQKGGISGVSC